jgi:hypothetical protein
MGQPLAHERWRVCEGTGRFPHCLEEGGSWGKCAFLHFLGLRALRDVVRHRGIAGGMEDAEDPERPHADVLEDVRFPRRKVNARAGPHGRALAAHVEDPLSLQDVRHLLVGVVVRLGPPGRDRADELGDRAAADLLVRHVAKLPVPARGMGRLVGDADLDGGRPLLAVVLGLEGEHGDEDELVRARVGDLVGRVRGDEQPGFGLEGEVRAVKGYRAGARDGEEKLLPARAPAPARAPRGEADHPLLEGLAAEARPDGHANRGGVALVSPGLGRGLVGHVAHRLVPASWAGAVAMNRDLEHRLHFHSLRRRAGRQVRRTGDQVG